MKTTTLACFVLISCLGAEATRLRTYKGRRATNEYSIYTVDEEFEAAAYGGKKGYTGGKGSLTYAGKKDYSDSNHEEETYSGFAGKKGYSDRIDGETFSSYGGKKGFSLGVDDEEETYSGYVGKKGYVGKGYVGDEEETYLGYVGKKGYVGGDDEEETYSGYAGKKGYVGKGYAGDDDEEETYSGYAGKKGYSGTYAGKKGGYSGALGGKKGYTNDPIDNRDDEVDEDDEVYSGKKGYNYGGKKGGGTPIRDDDCEICGIGHKNRPESLTLQYVAQGQESYYQDEEKSTCEGRDYPLSTTVISDYGRVYQLNDGDIFTIEPEDGFDARTIFTFPDFDDYECEFHTSCSQPLVAGDQHGPFLILPDNDGDCSPPPPPSGECVICDKANKIRPRSLTMRYHVNGENSKHQDSSKASCRAGSYPDDTTLVAAGQTFEELGDGDIFTLYPEDDDRFEANTEFKFVGAGIVCTIHTSCSVPLVVGDQIGPFEIMAGNDCELQQTPEFTFPPTRPPTPPPTPAPITTPTLPPSPEPTRTPTSPPTTMQPTSPPTTMQPTSPPTLLTGVPTRPPTLEPTTLPPTASPSTPPSDVCIEATVRLFEGRTVIDIDFNYPHLDPLPSDWIGLYPCSDADLVPPFSKEASVWAYTCHDRVCRDDDPDTATGMGSFTFDDATQPGYARAAIYDTITELIADAPGCYVVLLNRIDGLSAPPYYGICEGNEIELMTSDTPRPLPTSGPTPGPTSGPTPGPTRVPTPGPSSPPTFRQTAAPTNAPTASPTNAPTASPIAPAPTDGGDDENPCANVCGGDKVMTKPDGIFAYEDNPPVPCSILQVVALGGVFITQEECSFLPGLIEEICGCELPDRQVGCSVCGNGKVVTLPNNVFEYVGYPAATCAVLQTAGYNGLVPQSECGFLPALIEDTCGCDNGRL
eukprot:CAMPEP_0194227058 /NCGR_PEP_ID=MMETSP0156-20130528/42663_1 /TAXON_ID=33649 /ORGANISM="Thalassionema nitzschioides, Strain L26-B" /LENGTH=923 /DNA_ID=CAMNT_0038959531 /DNA_START=133 /DNA_END=2904 /DNA_ORIENTATION=-